jgi:hypothetical protein
VELATFKTIFDKNTTFEEESDGTFHITKYQDVDPILKANKEEHHSGINSKSDLRKVASIPLVVWQNWMKETNGAIQKDEVLLAKYLNDPDNKFLRTHNSRV